MGSQNAQSSAVQIVSLAPSAQVRNETYHEIYVKFKMMNQDPQLMLHPFRSCQNRLKSQLLQKLRQMKF